MIDILAVGAHADDVELGIGGIIARSAAAGHKVIIVDITDGALATAMSPADRADRAERAAVILGASQRINLGLPDRKIYVEDAAISRCVTVIRQLRPKVVLIPDRSDRHPDHSAAYRLWVEALFSSGLSKYGELSPFRPRRVFRYGVIPGLPPDTIIDVSAVYEQKLAALGQYELPQAQELAATRSADHRAIQARDVYYGSLIGTSYAETVAAVGHLVLNSLL